MTMAETLLKVPPYVAVGKRSGAICLAIEILMCYQLI